MMLGIIGTALAGGAVGAGEAGKQFGQYLEKSTLQDEAAKIQSQRDQTLQGYAKENIQTTATAQQETHRVNLASDTANIPVAGAAQTGVEVDREAKTRPGFIARTQEEAKTRAEAPLQARISFADQLREITSKDDAAKSASAAATLVENMKDPEYVKALRTEVIAKHPPESSATIAQAQLAQFQLGQAKQIAALQQGYAEAESSGNEAGKKTYADRISALGFTGKWSNMAPLLTAGTTLMKAAETEMDPAAKASMQAQAGVFFKMAGVTDKGVSTPTPAAIAALKTHPDKAGEFDAMFGQGSAAKLLQASATTTPRAAVTPQSATPATQPQPAEKAAPNSPASRLQQGIVAQTQAKTQASQQSIDMVRQAFARDVATMTPQDLYDQYNSLLGKLTPDQEVEFQKKIREAK